MHDGFWNVGGMVISILSLLFLLALNYLIFVLERRTGSRCARVALVAAVAALVVSGVSSLFNVYFNANALVGFGFPLDFSVLFGAWHVISLLESLSWSVLAISFLGLAISQRRSKSRVARRRKT